MKKVFKFVKGKKDEKKDAGGITPSQSGDLISPAQTPEDEKFLALEAAYGYDVDLKDKTLTKLHKAAWQGNLEKLKSALKKVDVDAVDKHNRTALHYAVAKGHPSNVWYLLGNNAKTSVCDDEGYTPLLKAVECGHTESMKLLLDRGAGINATDYSGNTSLHIAISQGCTEVVSALLKKGADTEIRNNAGDYPLHIATRHEHKDIVDLLLDAGACVDVLDRENRTPLMMAAKNGNMLLVELFVERGAQLTVVDSNNWTAQDYAMLGGHEEVVNMLKGDRKKDEDSDWNDSQSEKDPIGQKLKNFFEKCEEVGEETSPEVEAIPPYCQPPKSWEMIQAGMIDDNKEPKRRSITTLGTLHSRRESFTEGTSPKFLSLNRRKDAKGNAFAKQRLSFNEEESLKYWINEEKTIRKDLEKIELENMLNLEEVAKPSEKSTSESDWDSISVEKDDSGKTQSGTLGRDGTMNEVEEIWVANPTVDKSNSWDSEKEGSFPPPPTALELGVDMAKSIKYMKGISIDQPESVVDRNLWKTYESHSLDRLEELEKPQVRQTSETKCQKLDVTKRINEQLECYDQALRELAESSRTFHSLPFAKSQKPKPDGPFSMPIAQKPPEVENNETLGSELPHKPKNPKRHMLLAMRDVKHAVHVTNSFKTSTDDQILSPLTKPDSFELDESKAVSSSSDASPADENPFFGLNRQETVLERQEPRKSSSSGSEEPTLWLQDEQKKGPKSEDDTSDLEVDEELKKGSFSPLGVLHREMEEESRGKSPGPDWETTELRRSNSPYKDFSGENEESNEEIVREASPDISLSSGPIEPLGTAKDSGSEPESSHNDVTPTHNYSLKRQVNIEQSPPSLTVAVSSFGALRKTCNEFTFLQNQHEWLKSHLKAATSEKNKLEEITAQLTEKAERLQYELADAREAAKSRDEVIQLLQGQLARMEAAYTKSLEESVQSRLQLTSHEQEILHLKELCYKYEEEKESAMSDNASETFQELQSKIKTLEEEKSKMREEIVHLEEAKRLLEKRLNETAESEIIDQCQRWKERCGKLEEMAKAYDSKQAAFESYVQEKDRELIQQIRDRSQEIETKYLQMDEENIELKAKFQKLKEELELEKKKSNAKHDDEVSELKKRNLEMEIRIKNVEKEMEERVIKKLKEKEEEVRELVKQFNKERDGLVAAYERKLLGEKSEDAEDWRKENQKLKMMLKGFQEEVVNIRVSSSLELRNELQELKDQFNSLSKSIMEMQKEPQVNPLLTENLRLSREISDLKARGSEMNEDAKLKIEILELKNQVNSLNMMLDGEKGISEKKQKDKRRVGKEDELAWSSLYGIKATRRMRGLRSASATDLLINIRKAEESAKPEEIPEEKSRLEFIQLKKEIKALQNKMSDEKNCRHALENQLVQMHVDLKEKENLEKEITSFKRKINRDYVRRSDIELFQYEKELESKEEKYLKTAEDKVNEGFKAKCEMLAKEREKVKEIRKAKSFDPGGPPQVESFRSKFHSYPGPHQEVLFHPRPLVLHPEIKNELDQELDKSIRKYIQESSTPSISNEQKEFVKKKYF